MCLVNAEKHWFEFMSNRFVFSFLFLVSLSGGAGGVEGRQVGSMGLQT